MRLDELTTSYMFMNADPETLDSLEKALTPDLYKAKRDTSKLVQVERQITSPQGNSFTRKYWVNPNQVRDTDTVIGGAQNLPSNKKNDKGKTSSGSKGGSIDAVFSASGRDAKKSAIANAIAGGASRNDIISAAKKNGISWKETDNPAINWMRASMAITGTTTRGAKASQKAQQPNQQNTTQASSKQTSSNSGHQTQHSIYDKKDDHSLRNAQFSGKYDTYGDKATPRELVNAVGDHFAYKHDDKRGDMYSMNLPGGEVLTVSGPSTVDNGYHVQVEHSGGRYSDFGTLGSMSEAAKCAKQAVKENASKFDSQLKSDKSNSSSSSASDKGDSSKSKSMPMSKADIVRDVPELKNADFKNLGGVIEIDAKKGTYGNMDVFFTRNVSGKWRAEATWPGHSIPATISMGGRTKFSSLKTAHEAVKLASMSPRIKGATQGLSGKSGLTLAGKKPGK